MKFKMNPNRAYLLGLWKSRKTKSGVGVEGRRELVEVFAKTCLDEKLALPNKMQYKEGALHSCFFYNSALKAWLQEELGKREERLRYKNEFSANYFAGLFDARGGWQESSLGMKIPFVIADKVDEIVLLRLGFRVKRQKGVLAMLSPDFYSFIEPYLKLEISRQR
ncbi:MAG: hypothetical protein QW275_01540 [Candidatus Anstonellaceae archaeon]